MRLNGRMFGSRVAHRTFAGFVAASLIPIAAVAVLLLVEVGSELEERAFRNLGDTSRSIGQQTLHRVVVAASVLERLPRGGELPDPVVIDAAYVEAPDGRTNRLLGDLALLDFAVAPMRPVLRARLTAEGVEILIARPAPEGVVVGRIEPGYLWGSAELVGYGLETCVFSRELPRPLFCTVPLSAQGEETMRAAFSASSSGNLSWAIDGAEQLTSYWDLFLPSRFESSPWTIAVTQPAELALESLQAFRSVFVKALAVSLFVALLLSAYRIRKVLEPLDKLVAGTRSLAQRDFTARIEVDGRDEFGELGCALNDMGERLGRQFSVLTALSDLDALILSSRSLEHVIESLLVRLGDIMPGAEVSVLLVNADEPSRGRMFSMPSDAPAGTCTIARVSIGEQTATWLVRNHAGMVAGSAATGELAIFPMLREDVLRGALIARFAAAATDSVADRELLREFAGRISVAVSAIDRERELFNRAHFDQLTGLPNRQLCHDRLGQAIAHARREGHQLAVLFIDLDGFKHVNDSLGHSLGDELLRQTARRMESSLRETDTLARLGGDEYVVILPRVHNVLEAETVAETLIGLFKDSFDVGGQAAFVGASIGLTIYPNDGETAEELLRRADTAMYTAKDSGRGRSAFFSVDMDRRAHERLSMQTDLRNALDRGELYVVYQPQVELGGGRVVCAEALLRWSHPAHGDVPPSVFVPILEELGLIEPVGAWVLETALADLVRWRALGVALERVAVNTTTRELFSESYVGRIANVLRRFELTGGDLELELTESGLVSDFNRTNAIFRELRSSGIRMAIDDFGTGYSSLVYLNELTFDTLKIDRAFVSRLPSENATAIVHAVIAVARALGKETVAEGVELTIQEDTLKKLGCGVGQGYLYGKPVVAADFSDWAKGRSRRRDRSSAA